MQILQENLITFRQRVLLFSFCLGGEGSDKLLGAFYLMINILVFVCLNTHTSQSPTSKECLSINPCYNVGPEGPCKEMNEHEGDQGNIREKRRAYGDEGDGEE